MNAICLIIDRLHAGYLGCYGNTWVSTPALDRLAGGAFLFDQGYIDITTLDGLYRSYWLGMHALAHVDAENQESLPELLKRQGVSTSLLTDERAVADHPLASTFEQRAHLKLEPPPRMARDLHETQLARFFAAGMECLREVKPPFLLWLHTQGLGATWDAPWELRERYTEEGDPAPPESVAVPAECLPPDADPDHLLGIRQAYAAGVSVLDYCIDAFLDGFDASARADETLLVVLSARGFPLGVHGRIGEPPGEPEALFSEVTAVPWLMRVPDGSGASDRGGAFVQPADLSPTLLDWWSMPQPTSVGRGQSVLPIARGQGDGSRDRACIMSSDGQRALRTPAWYARFPSPDVTELYAKPDDRWEINEVSDRCTDVAQAMWLALADWEKACGNDAGALPSLDESLIHRGQ